MWVGHDVRGATRAARCGAPSRSPTGRPRPASPEPACCSSSTSVPSFGAVPCGCSSLDRKPRHSYLPVPFVGRPEVHVRVAVREPPAGEHRDVVLVGVEPVERELDLVRGVEEALDVGRTVPSFRSANPKRAHDLAVARRARGRERDALAFDGRVADHRPVHRLVEDHRRAGAKADRARRRTSSSRDIDPRSGSACRHRTAPRRRCRCCRCPRRSRSTRSPARVRAPRKGPEPGKVGTAGVDAAAVHVDLVQDPRVEVADLRSRDEERVAGR